MLAAIESRMEELFETMESMPPDKIEAAEKVSGENTHTNLVTEN